MNKFSKLALFSFAALCAVSASFAGVVYQQTSATGLTVNTALIPDALDDVTFSSSQAGNLLSALTLAVGVLPGTTQQTGRVFVDFYDSVNPASTGIVESGFLGGFNGSFTVTANTGTGVVVGTVTFGNLAYLGLTFTDNNVGVEIYFTNSAGTAYSSILTPVSSVPGVPTVGSSITGLYRDTSGDGDFQATEFDPSQGNLYLSISTISTVPEPSTLALLGGASVLGASFYLRRGIRKS
jgi:hypothetical protein